MTDLSGKEAKPNLSIGLPYENPFGFMDFEPAIRDVSLIRLSFLANLTPETGARIPIGTEVTLYTSFALAADGLVAFAKGVERQGARSLICMRSIGFSIFNPSNIDVAHTFEVTDDPDGDEMIIEDYGKRPMYGSGPATADLAVGSIMLNALGRGERAPDWVPDSLANNYSPDDEHLDHVYRAAEEVLGDHLGSAHGHHDSCSMAPIRRLKMSEPFARKIIPVIEAIVLPV